MYYLKALSPGFAWKKAQTLVKTKGNIVHDEGQKLTELLNVIIEVTHPTKIDSIIKKHGEIGRAHV